MQYLHERYGSLPWRDLVDPAVRVARYGFEVSVDQAAAMDSMGPRSFLSEDPDWAIDFAPNGTRVGKGDTMTRKRYANLLELIAREGVDSFYRGDVARTTISAVRAAGGIMTLNDLTNYSVTVRSPLGIAYRGYKIIGCGAPAGGTVALNVMRIIDGYPTFGDPSMLNLNTHRLNEAIRFAYGTVRDLPFIIPL